MSTAADPDYSPLLLDHFRAPRNAGRFPSGTAGLLAGSAGSRRLGREVRVELLVRDGRVAECRYQVYGCPATIALCSLLSERVRGLAVAGLQDFRTMPLGHELGLQPARRAVALLLDDALRAALKGYNSLSEAAPLRA